MTYTLTRSRRRTVSIRIKPDGNVEVRAPLQLAKSEIDRIVASKSAWIAGKRAEIALRRPAEPRELPPSLYAPDGFGRAVLGLVKEWEARLGVTVSFIGVRRMSSRWGSCTSKTRRIRFSAALEYCPHECLEYVVVHELAHIREGNHSPRVWAIVADALPDYKARQLKLREFQWILNMDAFR
jgi:predicted metal-dependent hydrolase